jgi:hypothetical protein
LPLLWGRELLLPLQSISDASGEHSDKMIPAVEHQGAFQLSVRTASPVAQ